MPADDRVWLIVNPTAGQKFGPFRTGAEAQQLTALLERRGLRPRVELTDRAGHATELARAAAESGAKLVVVAGGDGTVHEAARGLIGTDTALGVLPLGSVMNVARALGIPRDLEGAAEVIRAGRSVRMDVGRASTATHTTWFFEAAGVGVDAGVFAYSGQLEAGRWGSLRPLLRFLVRFRPRRARLSIDGRALVVRAYTITVAVGPYVGLGLAVAPDARIADRQLDVVVRAGFGRLEFVRHVLSISFGRRLFHPKAQLLRGRLVEVDGVERRLMVHADGAPIGLTPARFELVPAALSVVVGEPSASPALTGAPAAPSAAPPW